MNVSLKSNFGPIILKFLMMQDENVGLFVQKSREMEAQTVTDSDL